MNGKRIGTIVAVFIAVYLVASAQPVAAANVSVVSSNTTASELSAGTITNAEVARSGDAGMVEHDTYRSSAVARWAFDYGSGDTAYDHVGSNDGTLNGDPQWVNGVVGKALEFDGSGDHVETSTAHNYPVTASIWFNRNTTVNEAFIESGFDYSEDEGWLVRTANGDFIIYVGDNSQATGVSAPSDGNWHLLTISINSSEGWKLYLDGDLRAVGNAPANSGLDASLGTQIGASEAVDNFELNGMVDDPRLYQSVLTPGQVARLYEYPNAKLSATPSERWALDAGQGTTAYGDEGGNGMLNEVSWTNGISGNAVHYDGDGDYIEIPDNDKYSPDPDLSVSAWVYVEATGETEEIYDKAENNNGDTKLSVLSDDAIRITTTDGSSWYNFDSSPNVINRSEWEHVLFSFDDSADTINFYVNGKHAGSDTISFSIPNSNDELHIGHEIGPTTEGSMNGSIDELRFYQKPISQSEAQHLFKYPNAQLPEASQYQNLHAASNTVSGWTDLDIDNASATVTWEGSSDGGSSWTTLATATVSSSQNLSQSWSEYSGDEIRVTVDFSTSDPDHVARLHDEGVSAQTADPSASNLQPDTSTTQDSSVTLEADISDSDFATAQGDTVTIDWYLDANLIHSSTTSSPGTVSHTPSTQTSGSHDWHVELEDAYGNTYTSSTASFSVADELFIYNESNPTQLVDSATVEIRMYTNETGSPQTFERSTSDGSINMSGLPANKPFVVVASADNFTDRRIFVPSLYEQQKLYLLTDSKSSEKTIFKIEDYTGNFPSEETVLIVQRSLNGSYQTVLGDFFGATDQFPAELRTDKRHYLILMNVETGQTRPAGTYTPITPTTQTITVTPKEVERFEGEPTQITVKPQSRQLPATNGTTISVSVLEGKQTIDSWNVTATLVGDTNTTVWTDSQSSEGSANKTLNLTGEAGKSLGITVTYTADGVTSTKYYDIQVIEHYEHDTTLLAAITSLANQSPAGNARQSFTTFLSMLLSIFTIGAVARVQPSGELAGATGVFVLGGLSAIGWVEYDLVFVAAVGLISFAAIRRGL